MFLSLLLIAVAVVMRQINDWSTKLVNDIKQAACDNPDELEGRVVEMLQDADDQEMIAFMDAAIAKMPKVIYDPETCEACEEMLCVDESISHWYGYGGCCTNCGLRQYVAVDTSQYMTALTPTKRKKKGTNTCSQGRCSVCLLSVQGAQPNLGVS